MTTLRGTIATVMFLVGGCSAGRLPTKPPTVHEQTPMAFFLDYRTLCSHADVVTLGRFYGKSSDARQVQTLAEIDAAEGRYLAAVRDRWGDAAADREATAFQLDGPTDDRTAVELVQGDNASICFHRKELDRLPKSGITRT